MGRGTGRCLVWPERGPGGGLHRGHVRRPFFSTSGRRPVAVADRRRRRPIRYLTCDGAGQAWCLPRPRRVGVDPRGAQCEGSVASSRCPGGAGGCGAPGATPCGLAALGRPQGDPDRGCRAALADSRRPFAPGGSQTAVAGNRRVCRGAGVLGRTPQGPVNLAGLYTALGDYQKAEAAYRRALRLQPRYIPAYVNMAQLLSGRQREQEAEALLRQGLKINPQSADLNHALGLSLVRGKTAEEALAALAQAAYQARENAATAMSTP